MKNEKGSGSSGSSGSTLDDNRIIYFCGDFEEDSVKEVISKLFEFESSDPTKDIILYVDSFGGEYHSFISLHDSIRLLRCDVATVCIGKAMSCGQLLLMSGTKGKRFVTPNSTIMIHQIASGTWGKLATMENHVCEVRRYQEIINNLVLQYTKISSEQIKDFMSKDTFLSAERAIEYGVADYVIRSPADLYSRIKV